MNTRPYRPYQGSGRWGRTLVLLGALLLVLSLLAFFLLSAFLPLRCFNLYLSLINPLVRLCILFFFSTSGQQYGCQTETKQSEFFHSTPPFSATL